MDLVNYNRCYEDLQIRKHTGFLPNHYFFDNLVPRKSPLFLQNRDLSTAQISIYRQMRDIPPAQFTTFQQTRDLPTAQITKFPINS